MLGALLSLWRWWSRREWRVQQGENGLWYVEVWHPDLEWTPHDDGHKYMTDAAKEGRDRYGLYPRRIDQ